MRITAVLYVELRFQMLTICTL